MQASPLPPPPLRPGASSTGPGASVATANSPGLGSVSSVPGRGLGTAGYLMPTSTLIAFNEAQRILGADQVAAAPEEVEELMQATREHVRTTRPRSRGTSSPLPPLTKERRRRSTSLVSTTNGARGGKNKIDISAMYERFDDVRHVEPNETAALKRLSLTDWLASYQQEMHSYSSVSIYAETKLSEAMRMDAERTPSAFRTAVCADLFYKVCDLFGRYSGLMQTIGDELCRSIYADFPADSPPRGEAGANSSTAHFELTPFFNANNKMAERVEQLEKLVEDLSDTTKFYERESRTRAKAIDVARRPLRALRLQIYFKEWIKAVDKKTQRLMGIVMQWKDAKAQQMLVRCLFQGWKRMAKESLLARVQTDYEAIKISSTQETRSLREMLEKTSGRLEMATSIGDNRAAALTRVLEQFQKPGAVEAMRRRRRDSIVQLSADIESVGLLDRDLRATFDGILEFIDQDAVTKQTTDAAADEARRLAEEQQAASAAKAAENDAMQAADHAERERILAAPKKRAMAGRDDTYIVRRIEALSWSAEALIIGPMGAQRIQQASQTVYWVPPQPPILTPLLREYETTEEVLLSLPVPALLERWLTFQLRQAKVFSLAEQVETTGTADVVVLAALISRIDPTGYSWREQNGPTSLTPPAYEPGHLTAKDMGDDGADEDEDEVAAAFNTQMDAAGLAEEDKASSVVGAVRLLLCEGYSTVAVQEDLVAAATKTPEAAAASAAAVGHMIAQLFLQHPSLPIPEEVCTASLRASLEDVQNKWATIQTQGWRDDKELEDVLGELASLVEVASELQTKQHRAAALWPLIVQRVREYTTAVVSTMSSSDTGSGKALLALRPSLEGSEAAAAAAKASNETTTTGKIVIGGTASGDGGFITMGYTQLAELFPKGMTASEQAAELKAAQRVLLENERNLWLIYREYCADDGVLDGQVAEDGLTSSDLARFIKDVRFPRSMLHTQLLRPLLDSAKFDNSLGAWEPDTFDPDPEQDDPDAERGWSFSEFTEALCRLAATAYPTSDCLTVTAAKDPSSSATTWLSNALKQLLNDHILPRVPASGITVAVDVGVEDFRRRVGSSAVRAVHKKFLATLRKLFRHYAKAEQRGEMVSMSLFQLVEFCQDMGLSPSEDSSIEVAHGHNLQIHDVRKMFAAAVAAVDVGQVKAVEEANKGSMVFFDFLECLAAFAGYCYTDPYLPLEAKLGQLLAREILPNAKRLGTV